MNSAVSAHRLNAMLSAAMTHHKAGRFAKALPHFRKYLKRRPDDIEALNMASFAAFQSDHADMALSWLNTAKAAAPDDPQTFYNLGLVSQSIGLYDDAAAAYRRACELEPDSASAHYNLGTVLNQLGRLDEAIAAYDEAIEADPGHGKAHSSKAFILRTEGKSDDAIAAYGRAASIQVDDPTVLTGLGKALQDAGRLSEAVSTFARAIAADPDYPEATSSLADVLVQREEPLEAITVCDAFLERHPINASVLAAKSIALNEANDKDAMKSLVDLDRFVSPIRHERAPGFKDMAAFNDAIADHVTNHPTLITSPTSHATRLGKHTADLTVKPKGPIAAFEKLVGSAVDTFVQRLGPDSAHPFIANRPRRWHLAVWSIVLEGEGYQVSHIHRAAWLSGVYYAKVPAIVNDGGNAGWIEFGEPGPEYHWSAEPEAKTFQPKPGLMVLFPSYMFHRTIPFESDETRISVAFDVVPDA
ncbi:MAG: tetratricopeptide repeat protein [Alphaproteobacteria bacterium]|nr:tetratricopeptide repeat protein [Alphaproteobacteria bacterium]